jgi:hypothetical protein
MLRVSTGKLTANDMYVLDENVLQKVLDNNRLAEAVVLAKDNWKLQKINADKSKLRDALIAFPTNPDKLNASHLRILITATAMALDGPTVKTKGDLEAQFRERNVPLRLQSYLLELENNANAENIPPLDIDGTGTSIAEINSYDNNNR